MTRARTSNVTVVWGNSWEMLPCMGFTQRKIYSTTESSLDSSLRLEAYKRKARHLSHSFYNGHFQHLSLAERMCYVYNCKGFSFVHSALSGIQSKDSYAKGSGGWEETREMKSIGVKSQKGA